VLERFLTPIPRTPPSEAPEAMDRPDVDGVALEDALDALADANRAFGGRRAVLRPLGRVLAGDRPGPIRILDVGAGGGDVSRALARRLRSRGWRPRLVLGDLHDRTLRLARARIGARGPGNVRYVRLSASTLPFRDASFGLALSSTMLHHLEREEAVRFLREIERVADRAWVVTDLRRSRLTCAAVRTLAATLWRRNPLPRRDGPVSVRRSFTPAEARELLGEAGLHGARVERAGPFRLRLRGGRAA